MRMSKSGARAFKTGDESNLKPDLASTVLTSSNIHHQGEYAKTKLELHSAELLVSQLRAKLDVLKSNNKYSPSLEEKSESKLFGWMAGFNDPLFNALTALTPTILLLNNPVSFGLGAAFMFSVVAAFVHLAPNAVPRSTHEDDVGYG
jgi:hypothetical protein